MIAIYARYATVSPARCILPAPPGKGMHCCAR